MRKISPVRPRESGDLEIYPCAVIWGPWIPACAGMNGEGPSAHVTIDFIPNKDYIPLYPVPRDRGVSDQRLQTRGGERWPGNTLRRRCGEAPGGPSRARPGHPAGGHLGVAGVRKGQTPPKRGASPSGAGESPLAVGNNVCPPGIARSKPNKHRARDALGLADLRFYGFRQASMSRGVEVRGSVWTPGVPRALGTWAADGMQAYPAPDKEYGR